MTLLKYLQTFYSFSRRKAFRLIRKGKVRVNGEVITQPLHEVEEGDEVEVEGYVPGGFRRMTYVAFNKPPGFVVSRSDPYHATIYTLLPPDLYDLKAVGRLDKPSEGLLLLTNDGELIHRLTHPKYGVPRGYVVEVSPPPDERLIRRILSGIEDGGEVLRAHEARITHGGSLFVVLKQGRYREIRRMMRRVGRRVKRLKRVFYGTVNLDLPPGGWRYLTEEEVRSLKDLVGL